MQYKPFIHKHIPKLHPVSKAVFGGLAKVIGEDKAKVLKQKVKLAFKETPATAVTSDTERAIFNRIKDEMHVVFDVGIQNELSFYSIKQDCDYHLFEPNQKFVRLLKKQISGFKQHRITLNEFGLSDKDQDDCVYYEESESFVVNPAFKEGEVDTGMRYSLRTLDGYVSENNINHIDFLKIDTEGFDYNVILGGMKTIRAGKISYVQFEYWQGLQRFYDLLKDHFDLYIVMEPRLLKFIRERVEPTMTPEQKNIDCAKSLIPVTKISMDLIDNKISPLGAGCNIFCISKTKKGAEKRLIFDIKP